MRSSATTSEPDDGADHVARLQVVERALDVLEADDLGDHRGEVELPLERPVGELRKVALGPVVASVRDDDPQPAVEERPERKLRDRARLREADVNECAGVAEQLEPLRHGLRPPHDVEDEVEPLTGAGVRGAEALRRLELTLVDVERVYLRRARDPRALN